MSSTIDLDTLLAKFNPRPKAPKAPKPAPAAESAPYVPSYTPTAIVALRQVQKCACGTSTHVFAGLFAVGEDRRLHTERWEPIPTPAAAGDPKLPRQIRTRVEHIAHCLGCLSTTFKESQK